MFIINITFIKPFEVIEPIVAQHRAFLDIGYSQGLFVVSGPLIPRTGGVILSQATDRLELEKFLENDPYKLNKVAEYSIVEFNPVKFHEKFAYFVQKTD